MREVNSRPSRGKRSVSWGIVYFDIALRIRTATAYCEESLILINEISISQLPYQLDVHSTLRAYKCDRRRVMRDL